MNLTRLRYFIAVAETENVGRAAKQLNVAQPALSRQLKALESDVGAALLERHAKGVRLTKAGEALLSHARDAVRAAENGVAAARTANATSSPVRIAPPDWPHRANIVAHAVEVLRTTHPHMEVQFTATPWTISERALRAGAVDVGFAVAPVNQFGPDLAAVAWIPEPGMSALISARHPLAGRKSVRLADLRDTPTLIPPRAEIGLLHDQMAALIRSGGYEPKIVDSPLSYSAGAQMVAIGAGWIISTNSVAEVPPPGTVVLPIEDAQLHCDLYIVRRADDTRDAVLAFIDACMAAAKEWAGK